MATYTTRLNLKKPAPSDFYNIEDFNNNADKIDTKMLRIDDDKASQVDAETGTDNTKWMSPLHVRHGINILKANQTEAESGTDDTKWLTSLKARALIKKYIVYEGILFTTSKTWTVPDGCYRIYVYMISGGASGACKMRWYKGFNNEHGKGGSSGRVKKFYLNVTPGQQISVVIGAGGVSAYCNIINSGGDDDYGGRYGNSINGGDTTVAGISTAGGAVVEPTSSKTETVPKVEPMANVLTNNDINIDEVMGIAGGSTYGDYSVYTNDIQSSDRFGKKSALAVGSYRESDPGTSIRVKGNDATAYGGGGGGCGLHVNVNMNTSSTSYQNVVQGGKGGNGAAIIYPIYVP